MEAELSAPQARAQDPLFVRQCSLGGLQAKLPLRWPTPPSIPPSPKRAYRSHYQYLGWEDLLDPTAWEHLSDFDLTLRLIDYTGLRPVLAQLLGWRSARGWCPFDPISMFLLHGWQITNGWSRAETLENLYHSRYADYAQRFGFHDGLFPTEGGMRYFLTTLGANSQVEGQTVTVELDDQRQVQVAVQFLNQLIAGSVDLIRQADLLSPEAWQKALVCPDGMIHDAASRMRCAFVQDNCYQPTTPQAPRPCPAQEKGHQGCDCRTLECAQVCCYATPRDPQARLIVYSGTNQPTTCPKPDPAPGPERGRKDSHRDNPNQEAPSSAEQQKEGQPRYGYRTLPLQLADPQRRFSLVLLDDFQSAKDREENPSAALLRQLADFYPDLHLETTAGDAGLGYEAYLRTAYQLGAKRVVDLRAHETDRDKTQWLIRSYDDKGRPICPYGYSFTANGFDSDRKRHKWLCEQACLKGGPPLVKVENVLYPPNECPYQSPEHPHGHIINVGLRFADGSIRLVRDIPVGTPAWKRAYHRARNASESHHSTMERWQLKRLRVYGHLRGKAIMFQADAWSNLITLARLVREATIAARGP